MLIATSLRCMVCTPLTVRRCHFRFNLLNSMHSLEPKLGEDVSSHPSVHVVMQHFALRAGGERDRFRNLREVCIGKPNILLPPRLPSPLTHPTSTP
jgi:hypothetical protein